MVKDCSLKEIGERLLAAENVLIFPHVNMDGDSFGSSVALCRALRGLGKAAYIVPEEIAQANLRFLDEDFCISASGKRLRDGEDCSLLQCSNTCGDDECGDDEWGDDQCGDDECGDDRRGSQWGGRGEPETKEALKKVDVSICVDCGDEGRLGSRAALFKTAGTTLCIDHHHTNKPFCMFNHVEEDAAATGELVFQLLKEMGVKPDKKIGEALFTALSTDTGKFHYSNTRAFSHQMAAELYSWGIDVNAVSVELYQNESFAKKRAVAEALNSVEFVVGGKGAVGYITGETLRKIGASIEDTENVISEIRNIADVEIAAFLKERRPGEISVSLRAKTWGDVASIAESFGGGGHIKAAGCTLEKTMDEALSDIRRAVERALEQPEIGS